MNEWKRKIVRFLLYTFFLGSYVWIEKTWEPVSLLMGGGFWGTVGSVGMGIAVASFVAWLLSRGQDEGE